MFFSMVNVIFYGLLVCWYISYETARLFDTRELGKYSKEMPFAQQESLTTNGHVDESSINLHEPQEAGQD